MDVDNIAFPGRLLEILEAISNSLFVSFDLELSGVSSKSSGTRGKHTVQERYEEVKEAAERYQILQIGLTCVHLDSDRDKYVVRPYNFNLSPLMEEKLDIERIFSFQSGAAEFLLSHGFDIGQPFKHGVPYLSRDEARLAKKIAVDRLDKSNYEDIQLDAGETESLEFLRRVRQAIKTWEEKWTRNGKVR
jgi:poly(A)-specific ribonuclease